MTKVKLQTDTATLNSWSRYFQYFSVRSVSSHSRKESKMTPKLLVWIPRLLINTLPQLALANLQSRRCLDPSSWYASSCSRRQAYSCYPFSWFWYLSSQNFYLTLFCLLLTNPFGFLFHDDRSVSSLNRLFLINLFSSWQSIHVYLDFVFRDLAHPY